MNKKKFTEKKWYSGAVIACIGVAFYVLLTNLGTLLSAIGTFIGYFRVVILGVVFAYVINPLAKMFYYRVFRKMKLGQTRWSLSVILAFVTALLAVFLLLGTLLPQLLQSIRLFSENFDGYAKSLIRWLKGSPLELLIDTAGLDTMSENAMASISGFLRENAGRILNLAANSGKDILSVGIALILAVYLLMDKKQVLTGLRRLMNALLRRETSEKWIDFALRCDTILTSFLGQSLLDSLIVGGVNAIFMAICGMQYIGLISVVVGVTNLVPNFGPAIGGVIGAFVLLLINPWHALAFAVFCVFLQFTDGYILKPKLFSNSLGVSGLLILIASIVLGNMFGILGVLLSIPAAAILSFVYKDYFLTRQEEYRQKQDCG